MHMGFGISTKGDKFIDEHGRQVILKGINMVSKDRNKGYIGTWDDEDFNKLKSWGVNVIRLGIIWDGLEPQPGVYNDEHLDRMDRIIELAYRNDIWVILDMHQDLYSYVYGADGAPAWACLDDGLLHIAHEGTWSDAYFTSPAIQRAFDNFWDNIKVDDLGLQDHYAAAWQHVAMHYANNDAVIGYDIMNEPFMGSSIKSLKEPIYDEIKRILAEKVPNDIASELLSLGDIDIVLTSLEGRQKIISFLSDINIFSSLIDSMEYESQRFEREYLMPFYDKVAKYIRKVDNNSILFLETNITSNAGVRSGIEPIYLPNGKIDDRVAYAPHGYDIITDTSFLNLLSNQRINLILSRHFEKAKEFSMPIIVGEWGAFYDNDGAEDMAVFISRLFDKHLCSHTYWSYTDSHNLEQRGFFKALNTAYPMYTSGAIKSYSYNVYKKEFNFTWQEHGDIDMPTVIYMPGIINLHDIELEPKLHEFSLKMINDKDGYIIIPPVGRECVRSFRSL